MPRQTHIPFATRGDNVSVYQVTGLKFATANNGDYFVKNYDEMLTTPSGGGGGGLTPGGAVNDVQINNGLGALVAVPSDLVALLSTCSLT